MYISKLLKGYVIWMKWNGTGVIDRCFIEKPEATSKFSYSKGASIVILIFARFLSFMVANLCYSDFCKSCKLIQSAKNSCNGDFYDVDPNNTRCLEDLLLIYEVNNLYLLYLLLVVLVYSYLLLLTVLVNNFLLFFYWHFISYAIVVHHEPIYSTYFGASVCSFNPGRG